MIDLIDYFLSQDEDSRVVAYLKNHSEDLFPMKWDETLLDRKANPFPYTWEIVGKIIKDKKPNTKFSVLVAGCVGPEVASRFTAFCKTVQKIDIKRIIEDPKEGLAEVEKSEDKSSLYYAVISELAARWHRGDKALTVAKITEIGNILPPEFAVAFLKMIVKKKADFLGNKDFLALLEKLGIYFD